MVLFLMMSEEMNNPFKGVALIKRCLDYARHDKVVEGMVDMTRWGALGRHDKEGERLFIFPKIFYTLLYCLGLLVQPWADNLFLRLSARCLGR